VIAQSPTPGRRADRNGVEITVGRRPHLPGAPREVTLSSLGSRLEAPFGNACGRNPPPDGLLGCTRAYYSGHPTKRSLPVCGGGLLDIDTRQAARQVLIRLSEGVQEGGAPKGRVGADLEVQPVRGSRRRRWHARLPNPLDPSGGVGVDVSYPYGAYGTYYARVHPAHRRR
jgi:hypothetical protein